MVDKGVRTFLKGVSLKVNVTERLEFELDYFEAAVQHFSYYPQTLEFMNQL